jgi:hypothetical protein
LSSQPATTPVAASDLISFLKALPDCRMRRGVRFPQWWMLLVAILSILSGQGSLVGMERFAKRHRQTLNELLGTDFGKSPSDSTFRLLLVQLDLAGFESLLRDWMTAQPGVAELDTRRSRSYDVNFSAVTSELASLRERIDWCSSNSSGPPSSDGPWFDHFSGAGEVTARAAASGVILDQGRSCYRSSGWIRKWISKCNTTRTTAAAAAPYGRGRIRNSCGIS